LYLGGRDVKNAEKVWWIKVGASIGVALVTLAFQVYMGFTGETAFMVGVVLYVMISEVSAYVMEIDRTRSLKIGVGAFLFVWVMVWTLAYTVLQTLG
jgi:hypothetical protein